MAKLYMLTEAAKKGREFVKTLKETSFHINKLSIKGDGKKILWVNFFADGKEVSESGQFFIKLPEVVAHTLPGSYISPESFINRFQTRELQKSEIRRLLGNHMGREGDLAFTAQEDNFSLRVFHGSTNQYALKMSEHAASGSDNPQKRMFYQDNLSHIVEPIVKSPTDAPLRIVEDCLASGDTLPGVISTLAEKTKLEKNLGKVTIDVAVATAQGIFLLKKFAQDNGINIELNVGYLAFGLSQGVKREIGYEHANYITYPDEFIAELTRLFPNRAEEFLKLKGKQVVGDMGEFGKLIPERTAANVMIVASWNRYRSDNHGDQNSNDFPQPAYNESDNQHLLYLSNGGYLMRAYYNYFNNRDGSRDISEIVFSAKRRWTREFGYGVLLKDLQKEIVL
ncbi:hypothetical protein HZA76_00930 [Candidatus Roizmanbacteria bacterium]|nr:hypothetical protein [Candidatus Roizmanbacteria bacterium]